MNIRLICILFLIFSFDGNAQFPKTLDSLKVFLNAQKQDSTYVLALSEYTHGIIRSGNFNQADSLIDKINELSKQLNFPAGYYKVAYLKGFIEYNKQNPRKSLDHVFEGINVFKRYNLPKKYYQSSLNSMAILYVDLGDQNKAITRAMELVKYQETNNLKPFLGLPYLLLAENQILFKKHKEALVFYKKYLEIETPINNLVNLAAAETGIGKVYILLGNNLQAVKHLKTALKYAVKANYAVQEGEVRMNLGRAYMNLNQLDFSEENLKKAEKISRKLGSLQSNYKACQNLGLLYFKQRRFALAENYLVEALSFAKKIENPEHQYVVNLALADLFSLKKDFKKAYFYIKQSEVFKDSTFKLETIKNTENLLQKYNIEKKEQEIALLNAKNEKSSLQNKALIGGGSLVFLLTGVLVLFLVNKNKLKRLEESQKLRNKIATDLHDEIGSTLSSIMLISDMAKKQDGESQKMFTKINSDSKSVMESVDEIIWSISPMNDSLQGIILRLREYAQPLAESKSMKFEIKADTNIEKTKLETEVRRNLYLIVKEAVNNLMKYSEATEANVKFSQERNKLLVTIQDNGKGFDYELVTNRNGLKNMYGRATVINGSLAFETSLGNGSTLTLSVPMA